MLLMTDPFDEWLLAQGNFILPEGEADFLNIARDDVTPYTDDEKKANDEKLKAIDAEFEPLRKLALETLPDKLEGLRPSLTLSGTPACLSNGSGGLSLQMENLMRSAGQLVTPQKRVLEVSANNPAVKKLIAISENDKEKAGKILRVLYDEALLLEGVMPDNPAEFVKRVDEIMTVALEDG